MMRTGERGKAQFKEVSWDEAIAAVADKLAKSQGKLLCLSRPELSARSQALSAFLTALNAPAARTASFDNFALEQKAAELVFGWHAIPVYDIAAPHYVLSIGADVLGGWISPVYYARQFGQFRQGRSEIRGRLVQAESRMSLTAQSADEWLPVRPGTEPQFAVALMRILLDGKMTPHANTLPAATRASIEAADLPALVLATGIAEKTLRRVALELLSSQAPLVLGGASVVHGNSLDALIGAHYLNLMLGGALPKPGAEIATPEGNTGQVLQGARMLLLDGENPVYTLGASLADKDFIVSFSGFIDDSSAFADIILPDHHSLESEAAVMSPVTRTVAVGEQFVRPLYDTRSLAQTLTDLAAKMNAPFKAPDAKSFTAPSAEVPSTKIANLPLQINPPTAAGGADQFPYEFQPYLSLQYHDGRAANLPWMQELPDPASSAMWDLPVEIDPKSAAKLNLANGDRVRVTSPKGSLEAFVYIHPAALPGVISMPIGEGHSHYGRYASGRGANPLSILEPGMGAIHWRSDHRRDPRSFGTYW